MINRIATTVIAAAAFGLAALAGSATANATNVDDQFITKLANQGVVYDTNAIALGQARKVCANLASGKTGVQISTDITSHTNLSSHDAAVLIVESSDAYCPQYGSQITA
jgi:hypothetical protein